MDANDQTLGSREKMEAHRLGLLHRAFSIFIFNSRGEMLLQQRALSKYHSGGLWTNACCSHPMPGEQTLDAAHRRLKEELGFDTDLEKAFDFVYRAELDSDLTEHEFDHVFVGQYDGIVLFNKDEAMNCTYKSMEAIRQELDRDRSKYTVWFYIAFAGIEEWWGNYYDK